MLLQKTIKQIDIWDQVNAWILQHGAYLAALVLLLTALQWGLNIILLATALVREGPVMSRLPPRVAARNTAYLGVRRGGHRKRAHAWCPVARAWWGGRRGRFIWARQR